MRRLLIICITVAAVHSLAIDFATAQNAGSIEATFRSLATQLGSGISPAQNVKCGFGVLAAARSQQEKLSAQLRSDLDGILVRPELQVSVVRGAFRIHFDTSTVNAPVLIDSTGSQLPGGYRAFVDSLGVIANYVLEYETSVLGYLAPPTDNGAGGGNEYDIYIENLGNVYGYTYPEAVVNSRGDGSTWTSYITVDNDFIFVHPRRNIGVPALEVTIAHELHHAIQMGRYGFWEAHTYFYEVTSTWMEDVVYTNVNDYLNYLNAHFSHPETPFTGTGGAIEYARCLWGHFVAKKFGRDIMRSAWENISSTFPLEAMDNALRSDSSSFQRAFAEWVKWNYFTGGRSDSALYYPEGAAYPLVTQRAEWFVPPTRTIANSLPALSARYHKIASGSDTLILALANLNYGAAITNSSEQFSYSYTLSSTLVDPTYYPTPVGVYFALTVPDVQNWKTHAIVGDTIFSTTYKMEAGKAFPNPFMPGNGKTLSIPVTASQPTPGTMSVFSSSFDLIFKSDVMTKVDRFSDQQVFEWNGLTGSGKAAESGVYFLIIEVLDQTIITKVAVVRR